MSRLGRETDMLLATVASLSDAEMAAASLCEGWSRAEVLAHVASSGRALVSLIDGAVSGEERQLYASHQARPQEISTLAALPREELRESARNFAEQAQRLNAERAAPDVNVNGKVIPATSIVALRIAEVVVHHHDLDTAWTVEEADPDSLPNAIEAVVRSLRAKGAPGMTLVTEERDEWVIGDGACALGRTGKACSSGSHGARRPMSKQTDSCLACQFGERGKIRTSCFEGMRDFRQAGLP